MVGAPTPRVRQQSRESSLTRGSRCSRDTPTKPLKRLSAQYFYNSKTKVSTWVRPGKNSRGDIIPEATIAANKAARGGPGGGKDGAPTTPNTPVPMSWSRLRRPGLSGDTEWYLLQANLPRFTV